jgi:hypothetical protein
MEKITDNMITDAAPNGTLEALFWQIHEKSI